MANVKGRLDKWACPFFGEMALARAQPTHARAFKADLLAQGLAPSTVKAVLLTTGQVFAQAVDDGLIVRSPFSKIQMPEDREHAEQHFLTVEQVELLATTSTTAIGPRSTWRRSAAYAPVSFGRSNSTG